MAAVLEASLFGQICGNDSVQRLKRRLKAIGSPPVEYFMHEQVCRPADGSTIAPPVPSMRPANLRIQTDKTGDANNHSTIVYYGVPEVNANRHCTVLPMLQSHIELGDSTMLLANLGFSLEHEMVRRGFTAVLGPHNELVLRVFQLLKVPVAGDLASAFPLDNDMWIVQLASECESALLLADRDVLLHESGKIFDDIVRLQHLDNRLFSC